jgi:hypothetical protein
MLPGEQQQQVYRVMGEYRDKANRTFPEDQFARWVTPDDGPSVQNTGGIRPQRVADSPAGAPPAVVYLFTTHVRTVFDNPWTDRVDHTTATIEYWGDARASATRLTGNRLLQLLAALPPAQRPPILHFVRVRVGYLRFSGLCAIRSIEERDFEDSEGNHVPNLFVQLTILDAPEISLDWIRGRVMFGVDADSMATAPRAWQRYRDGETLPLLSVPQSARNTESIPMSPGSNRLLVAVESLIACIQSDGYVYQPWQIAAYITALRTRPFVILAGVSGTGKSRLPALVAKYTGMRDPKRVSVRPDWNDSAEVLGYVDLQNRFRPGPILRQMQIAEADSTGFHTCIIDEMNLARVEYYFAEVLSAVEDFVPDPNGGFRSTAVLVQQLPAEDAHWQQQGLPANMAFVGTVNMDESTHSFSRKVLDRAFTIELSEIDFINTSSVNRPADPSLWSVDLLIARYRRVTDVPADDAAFSAILSETNRLLTSLNRLLVYAQMQVGYRIRDEIALFVRNASDIADCFRTSSGDPVSPLDLAIMMKVLPRLVGSSSALRQVLAGLIELAQSGTDGSLHSEPDEIVAAWESDGRLARIPGAAFPMTLARLCQMWHRLKQEGYTAFWL